MEGVAEELKKEGFAEECIDTYLGMFKEVTNDTEGVRFLGEKLKDVLEPGVAEDLQTIITTVDSVKTADFKTSFDLRLSVVCLITQDRFLRLQWMSSAAA